MAYKLFLLCSVFAMTDAGVIPAMTIAHTPHAASATVFDYHNPHPQYNFAYDVHDPATGDIKRQQEARNGDVVHGQYSLIEPDGSRRTVNYAADSIHGFNAIINRDLPTVTVTPIPQILVTSNTPTAIQSISASAQASAIVHPQPIITHQPQVILHARPVVVQQSTIVPQHPQVVINQPQVVSNQQQSITAHPPILNAHVSNETPISYNHPTQTYSH